MRRPGGKLVVGYVALAVFVLSCSAVGFRLIWIGARQGMGPAWSCGLGFTLIAAVGHPLTVASGVPTRTVGEVNHGLAAAGILFVAAGLSSFFAFTLTVFRRESPWAWVLTSASVLGLASAAFGRIGALASADRALVAAGVGHGWGLTVAVLSVLCYAWLGFEGLLEWRKSRRRLALGLVDPVVSNRFLMWGVFGVSTTLLSGFMLALQLAGGQGSSSRAGEIALAVFGLASSAAVMLAFVPPRRYVERIRARAAARG